jgi:hypothetical protein
MSVKFDRWVDELREDVVQGEYGYEPGEFTVYPDEWRPLYKEGLTPSQAFCRALDAFAEARAADDRAKAMNWERIQAADAATLAEYERGREGL